MNYGNKTVTLTTTCGSFLNKLHFDSYKSNQDDRFECHFVPLPSPFCGNSLLNGRFGVLLGPVPFRSEYLLH